MFVPAAAYDKEQIDRTIAAIRDRYPEDIERIRCEVRDDWAGDPAVVTALPRERSKSGAGYGGRTSPDFLSCLDLSNVGHGHNDARQLTKPDRDWLQL
jgi:hypothetical protein